MTDIVERIASETTTNVIERLRDAGFVIVREDEYRKLQQPRGRPEKAVRSRAF